MSAGSDCFALEASKAYDLGDISLTGDTATASLNPNTVNDTDKDGQSDAVDQDDDNDGAADSSDDGEYATVNFYTDYRYRRTNGVERTIRAKTVLKLNQDLDILCLYQRMKAQFMSLEGTHNADH